jgi:hypothetical protein
MRLDRSSATRASTLLLAAALAACAPDSKDAGGWLVDVTNARGLPPPPRDWPAGVYFMPEIMQGGVGLLDVEQDGDLDLFHVRIPPPGDARRVIANRLYRQDADGRFEDASAAAGLTTEGYGQGLAAGDVDNDGDVDVFVTNYGPDVLWRNRGDGRFEDVTRVAGFDDAWWGISAAFGDLDADGFLDLYVANYVRYDPGKRCTDPSDRAEYCGPRAFTGAPDQLWHNDGDGSFSERTAEAGIVLPQEWARGTGLGVVIADLTRDGRADVFVANDAQANQLWVNQGGLRFSDEAILRGVALNEHGQTEANMGVALGDPNGDGAFDVFVTHLWKENNRLWVGTPGPLFRDFSVESGLTRHDLERTGFGCAFLDLEHDGDLDLAVVNGAVRRRPPLADAPEGPWQDYVEPNQLFLNDGACRFTLADAEAGAFARELEASRGLALGDLDADGDLDLALSNLDNSLRLYRNDAPAAGTHWAIVRVLTRGRDALGAAVTLRAGGREWHALALSGYSYGSGGDPRAHFGLGSAAVVDELRVRWPDGSLERFAGGPADRVWTLSQGEGERQ